MSLQKDSITRSSLSRLSVDVVGLSVVGLSVVDGLLKCPHARVEPARHFIDVFREELEDLIRAHASSKKGARTEGEVQKVGCVSL